jgi:hypothetical protein
MGGDDGPLATIGLADNLKPDSDWTGLVIRTLAGTVVLTTTDK